MITRIFRETKVSAPKAVVSILIILLIIFMSGCLSDKSATGAPNTQTLQSQAQTGTVIQKAPIEQVSDELKMLNSKEWGKLAAQLGRPRATTLLWYHLKSTYSIDTKVVFGYPNKLNSALAIAVSTGGESSIPTITIKGIKYYIIDPTVPTFIGDFKYGDMFDDPGNHYLFGNFRLNTDDTAIVEQWIGETGVQIKYTDFPAK